FRLARLAGGKSALRRELGAVHLERLVMVGEAKHGSVAQRHAPAIAERSDVPAQMRLEFGAGHSRISISGMVGICPALNAAIPVDRCSMSNRTGTPNSKPAATATPPPGAAAHGTRPAAAPTERPLPAACPPPPRA